MLASRRGVRARRSHVHILELLFVVSIVSVELGKREYETAQK